jgi:Flp pilus assembly protein TadB
MSKLARSLALAVMVAAVNLATMTTVAQAHASDQTTGQDARRPSTQHRVTSQQQAARDASLRQRLAEQRSSVPTGASAQLSSPLRPAEPSDQAGSFAPALGLLAAVLALVTGVAVLVVWRGNRSHRAGQTAN